MRPAIATMASTNALHSQAALKRLPRAAQIGEGGLRTWVGHGFWQHQAGKFSASARCTAGSTCAAGMSRMQRW